MEAKGTNYERFPVIAVEMPEEERSGSQAAVEGYPEICRGLLDACAGRKKTILTVECYPGTGLSELLEGLRGLAPAKVIVSDDLAFEPEKMDALLEKDLTDDPVFGIMTVRRMEDFFYPEKLAKAREEAERVPEGIVLICGTGASLIHPGDILVYADITRWEIQLRYRRGMKNWRTAKEDVPRLEKYKRGYFAEWRWADRIKDGLLDRFDYYLDMAEEGRAAMVGGDAYRRALCHTARRPFRMVPYFDPGVWGGDWMKTHFGLPENGSNYAWSFDGVPEENSLLFDFGGVKIQSPALNLVYAQARPLLGEWVHARFGKEFPIRFDLLDTIHGQNLSLQVHPLTEYIQRNFNMHYTQDESYYILDAEGEDTCVYLGVKERIDPADMAEDLEAAQRGEKLFPAENYVNRIPVKKHDHLLIPAGTVHCSGANTMVLEISATPYIFTFKMWDWGRLDLNGKPRPVHLKHGLANVQWDRDTSWVKKNLVNQVTTVYEQDGNLVERTGLHEREFIDTFRVSTKSRVSIQRNGSVHVLNLVDGKEAMLVSENGSFEPFALHYAETCIVPEAAGPYALVSPDGEPVKIILACVRP